MFCKNCGREVEEGNVCEECGENNIYHNNVEVAKKMEEDKGGFGWGLLGCCIPIVGLVLFLVWNDSKPKTSKAAGIGALVAVICVVVFYLILFLLGFLSAFSYGSYYF